MRLETWPARLVFALGALLMIATSAPHDWTESKSLETELESEGQGDDQLVRIHVRLTDGVAQDARGFSVRLWGSVDRPASDLTIDWGDASAETPGAGPPQTFQTSDDFLAVYTTLDSWQGCSGAACERVFEGRIATESSEAYAMTLQIEVTISGSKEKQPSGEIEASVEVVDAP